MNTSHVTSFCSFADVYRPKYGILENVRGIASEKKSNKAKKLCNVNTDEEIDVSGETSTEEETSMEEGISTDEKTSGPATQSGSVLSRMIACLVSMGYQVNYFKMHSEK
jgi:site-specific DNA-cytosine methylase